MRRIHGLIDACNPYRYDLVIAAATLVAFVTSQMLSTRITGIEWFFNVFEIQVIFDFVSVESAIGIAITIAFVATLNVWLLFGGSRFKRRIATCLAFYALAGIGVFCGGLTEDLDHTARANVRRPLEFASELYVGVMIQAVCVVGLVSLVAIVLQLISKRRMSFYNASSNHHAASISDLFLATSLAAVTLTILKRNQTVGAGFTTLNFVVFGALISVAGALPPVMFAFSRMLLPIVTCLWFALLGPMLSIVFDVKQAAYHLVQVSAIHALAGFLVGLALMVLRYYGLRFERDNTTDPQPAVVRRWNPRFTVSLAITLALARVLGQAHLHLPTLWTAPWGVKYTSARAVVHFSTLLGQQANTHGSWAQPDEDGISRSSVRFRPNNRALTIREHPASVDFCRVAVGALQDWNEVDLWLDHLSCEHGHAFHGTTIDAMSIRCLSLEDGAIAELCNAARIRNLSLQCSSLSIRDVKTLAQHDFRQVSIYGLKVDNPELVAALSTIRFDQVALEITNSELLDLSNLQCRVLSFDNSRIGRRFLDRLPKDLQLTVTFGNCTFEDDVTDEDFQRLRESVGTIHSYGK